MELVGAMITSTVDLFKLEFTLFGFTLSFWQVFLFSCVAGIVAWILWRIFIDE